MTTIIKDSLTAAMVDSFANVGGYHIKNIKEYLDDEASKDWYFWSNISDKKYTIALVTNSNKYTVDAESPSEAIYLLLTIIKAVKLF